MKCKPTLQVAVLTILISVAVIGCGDGTPRSEPVNRQSTPTNTLPPSPTMPQSETPPATPPPANN